MYRLNIDVFSKNIVGYRRTSLLTCDILSILEFHNYTIIDNFTGNNTQNCLLDENN